MANNNRVKLTADIMEVASKYKCNIPKNVIEEILNEPNNKKVFRTDNYKNTSQVINTAKKLLDKRKKAQKELY